MYNVVKRNVNGEFISVMSGLGHNVGTWDSGHTRSTAYRHAKALNDLKDGYVYKVENSN